MAYIYLLLTALCMGSARCRRLADEIDSEVQSNDVAETVPIPRPQSFVKITKAPFGIVSKREGSRVELECEAMGSPPPVMQWMKENLPITQNEAFETNLINNISPHGRAITKIRLVINKAHSIHQGAFTCVAEAGEKVTTAKFMLDILRDENAEKNFTQLFPENYRGVHNPPRITYFHVSLLEFMGKDVALPCKTIGDPTPEVFWFDASRNVVSKDSKNRVYQLPDGELRIRSIIWADMGGYTCVAENPLGEDHITTFVYPMALKPVSSTF